MSITGDVGEARAFRRNSSQEQSGKSIKVHCTSTGCVYNYSCCYGDPTALRLLDEDSGDSDNETEEQRKVGELSPSRVHTLLLQLFG